MAPDRWRQVESLCHAALARPVGERAVFLAEACGDDAALRAEVESLIAQAASSPSFLEDPPAAAGRSLVGHRLGAYRIEQAVGAGGMGEVYRAKDTRLGRDVAVKILPGALRRRSTAPHPLRTRGACDRRAQPPEHLHHPRRRPTIKESTFS